MEKSPHRNKLRSNPMTVITPDRAKPLEPLHYAGSGQRKLRQPFAQGVITQM